MTLYMYIRLSMADEDVKYKVESDSIANQRTLLHQYVKMHPEFRGWTIEEFVDDGFSGTDGNRPAFTQMLQKLKQGGAKVVLCKDLSRFFRDYAEIGDYLERIFPSLGVRLIAVNDGYDSNDYIGTTGGMDVVLKCIVNAYYSRDLSQKVKSAQRSRARAGKYTGSYPVYGYKLDPMDRHHLIPDPAAAQVVKRIFALANGGLGTAAIAKILNEEKILTPASYFSVSHPESEKFKKITKVADWTTRSVLVILQRLEYTGAIVSLKRNNRGLDCSKITSRKKEDWIIVPGCHEALVSEDEYNNAQKVLSKRPIESVNQRDYLLRSLLVCGECGRSLHRTVVKKGNYFNCYTSRTNKEALCSIENHFSEQSLEQAITSNLRLPSSFLLTKGPS